MYCICKHLDLVLMGMTCQSTDTVRSTYRQAVRFALHCWIMIDRHPPVPFTSLQSHPWKETKISIK